MISSPLFNIEITEADEPENREPLARALQDFNDRNAPPHNYRPLGLLLKNREGEVVGGLWGRSMYDWLFVEILFVPELLRGAGVGRSLMQQAEAIARDRGCIGVWLDTFAFQALGFYQTLGYTIFGELKDHPRGVSQFWLQKRLD